MKNIGIFTFNNVPNYGAVLQAYALSNYLIKQFNKENLVDIVDFQCTGNGVEFEPNIYAQALCRSKSKAKYFYKQFLVNSFFLPDYKKKYQSFQAFRKKYLPMKPFGEIKKYDFIFLGSDQIWNPRITGGFQPEFFGLGDRVKAHTVASYAASCGDISAFSDMDKRILVKYLKNLDYIGVREKSLYDFLNQKNINCYYTVDPTFLLRKEDYDAFVSNIEPEEPYLLIYELQKNELMEKVAYDIAEEKRLKVKIISGYSGYSRKKSYEIRDAGPIEFLNMVSKASYIITNSFHGTAFSLIYNKPFNVILPNNRTSRIVDLLDSLRLNNRIIINGKYITNEIDYSKVNAKLQLQIDLSKKFINAVLLQGATYE